MVLCAGPVSERLPQSGRQESALEENQTKECLCQEIYKPTKYDKNRKITKLQAENANIKIKCEKQFYKNYLDIFKKKNY